MSGLMLLAALAMPAAADASTYRWRADLSGVWTVPGNWMVVEGPAGAGYPNLPGDVALFDDTPFTAARTVTIPDTVTISIGQLTVALSPIGKLNIASAGSGRLVFDNLGEDAIIESIFAGNDDNRTVLSTPIELAADVIMDGWFQFGSIAEAGGSRNVTINGGSIVYTVSNSYTGTTTITEGVLGGTQAVAGLVRMVGSLIIGDGTGAAGSARANFIGDVIDHSADVLVRSDGLLATQRNALFPAVGSATTVDELTVEGGQVSVSGQLSGAVLFVNVLNMEGGEVLLPNAGNVLSVSGAVNATSTAAGAAVVRSTSTPHGVLQLGSANVDFTIADGPQAVDFLTDVAGIGQSNSGSGLTKRGPGVMRIGNSAGYTGATSVMAGELIVNGEATSSAFTVSANAVLSGTGFLGSLTTQANGVVRPGSNPGTGILNSGPANLGGTLSIEVNSGTPGTGHDQLKVTGTVGLNAATLELAGAPFLPPTAVIVLIDNDGSDPVSGTFTGLPEGATVVLQHTTFQISYAGGDGNDVVLANVSPITYFLSEGATGTFFDEDVLIANPNTVPAPVTMTFFLQGGGTIEHTATVPAQSRLTVDVDEIDGLQNAAASVEVLSDNRLTLAVERTMFWDATHYGGHTANSVSSAERRWFFAEGAQNDFFNTFLLLANPGGAQEATVTFLRENEPPFVLDVPLAAQSRTNVYAGDHPQLVGRSFGVVIDTPSPITAERAMYFATTPQRLWSGGHDNVGSPETSTSWFHPEGASGTFFTTFILMSNPQNVDANVTMRFLLQDGTPIELEKTIPAQARLTVNPAAEGITGLQNASFATVVTSDVAIVSERAMYWNTDDTTFGEGHASSGLTTTALNWSLAEGRVGGPDAYTTYILLANPQSSAAAVKVTYLREGAEAVEKTYNVPANTRFNIDVGGMVSELQNESFGALIEVTNNMPIAVERSMYWNSEGRFWSGGTNAVGAVVPR